jgi:hypothetical protein
MNLPVYVSVTTIFQNQDILVHTLNSIINQTKIPDKIYLYLSEEPYILDKGFNDKIITDVDLLKFIENYKDLIEVNWVKNIGSYRKLLPILKTKWLEDCVIITIDDDTVYDNNLIKNLLDDYAKHNCVIGYRGFTPKFDIFQNFDYLQRDKTQNYSLYNFLTGKGGILYKPQFFHKTNELIFDDKIYLDTCDKQDDIWFYIIRIMNNINCLIGNKCWIKKELNRSGLYVNFNMHTNTNTNEFKKTLTKLIEEKKIDLPLLKY